MELCGAKGGTFDTDLGRCKCNEYTTFNVICNKTCADTSPSVKCSRDSSGTLQLLVTDKSNPTQQVKKIFNEYGMPDYDRTERPAKFVDMKSDGSFGVHPSDSAQALGFLTTPGATRKRRAVVTNAPEMRSPMMCINIGEVIVFKVLINSVNRTKSNYPQYRKDHLFNTNPIFDYGNFGQLHTLIQNTNESIGAFVQVFTEAGIYVFYDNAQPSSETIIVVPKSGAACPGTAAMYPQTTGNLNKFAVTKKAVSP